MRTHGARVPRFAVEGPDAARRQGALLQRRLRRVVRRIREQSAQVVVLRHALQVGDRQRANRSDRQVRGRLEETEGVCVCVCV